MGILSLKGTKEAVHHNVSESHSADIFRELRSDDYAIEYIV